jgi:hypothetical protein
MRSMLVPQSLLTNAIDRPHDAAMDSPNYTIEQVAALLGRTVNSIQSAARRLKLGELVPVEGFGSRRRMFTPADVAALRTVGRAPGNPNMRDPDKARELQARGVAVRQNKASKPR